MNTKINNNAEEIAAAIERYKAPNAPKDLAEPDFLLRIAQAETWSKMTEEERTVFTKHIIPRSHYSGSYKQRYNLIQDLYTAYLYGLGFGPNVSKWRD